jgi:hypothetical protein
VREGGSWRGEKGRWRPFLREDAAANAGHPGHQPNDPAEEQRPYERRGRGRGVVQRLGRDGGARHLQTGDQ